MLQEAWSVVNTCRLTSSKTAHRQNQLKHAKSLLPFFMESYWSRLKPCLNLGLPKPCSEVSLSSRRPIASCSEKSRWGQSWRTWLPSLSFNRNSRPKPAPSGALWILCHYHQNELEELFLLNSFSLWWKSSSRRRALIWRLLFEAVEESFYECCNLRPHPDIRYHSKFKRWTSELDRSANSASIYQFCSLWKHLWCTQAAKPLTFGLLAVGVNRKRIKGTYRNAWAREVMRAAFSGAWPMFWHQVDRNLQIPPKLENSLDLKGSRFYRHCSLYYHIEGRNAPHSSPTRNRPFSRQGIMILKRLSPLQKSCMDSEFITQMTGQGGRVGLLLSKLFDWGSWNFISPVRLDCHCIAIHFLWSPFCDSLGRMQNAFDWCSSPGQSARKLQNIQKPFTTCAPILGWDVDPDHRSWCLSYGCASYTAWHSPWAPKEPHQRHRVGYRVVWYLVTTPFNVRKFYCFLSKPCSLVCLHLFPNEKSLDVDQAELRTFTSARCRCWVLMLVQDDKRLEEAGDLKSETTEIASPVEQNDVMFVVSRADQGLLWSCWAHLSSGTVNNCQVPNHWTASYVYKFLAQARPDASYSTSDMFKTWRKRRGEHVHSCHQ